MFNYQSSNYIHSERQRQDMKCLFSQLVVLVKTLQLRGWFLSMLIAQSVFPLLSNSNPSLGEKTMASISKLEGKSFLNLILEYGGKQKHSHCPDSGTLSMSGSRGACGQRHTYGGHTAGNEGGSGTAWSPELHLIVLKGLVQPNQHTGLAFLFH